MVAALSIAMMPGDAAARRGKHVAHRHSPAKRILDVHASLTEAPHLGAMRDYGGPKYPMWRDVR
jgi:hypothetical protein